MGVSPRRPLKPWQRVVNKQVVVLPKYRLLKPVIRLKALARALEIVAPEAGGINQPKAFNAKAPHARSTETNQPVCLARGEGKVRSTYLLQSFKAQST